MQKIESLLKTIKTIKTIKAILPSHLYLWSEGDLGVICHRHFSKGEETLQYRPSSDMFEPVEKILNRLQSI